MFWYEINLKILKSMCGLISYISSFDIFELAFNDFHRNKNYKKVHATSTWQWPSLNSIYEYVTMKILYKERESNVRHGSVAQFGYYNTFPAW